MAITVVSSARIRLRPGRVAILSLVQASNDSINHRVLKDSVTWEDVCAISRESGRNLGGLLQQALVELAGLMSRQCLMKFDLLRALEMSQALPAVVDQRLSAD